MDDCFNILAVIFVFLWIIFIIDLRHLKRLKIKAVRIKKRYSKYDNLPTNNQNKFNDAIETERLCKQKRMYYINIIAAATIFIILLSCLKLIRSAQTSTMTIKNEVADNFQNSTFYISDIHRSIWSDLMNECLQFNIWRNQENVNDIELLTLNYANAITEMPGSGFPMNMDTVDQYVEELYFLGYLPKSERNLASIDDEILLLQENNIPISAELYLEELVKRIDSCRSNPSCSNFYQAGRSAKDVLYQKINSGNCTYQEMVAYASLAICFFRITLSFPSDELDNLKDDNCKITHSFIYEQIGMIFLQLHIALYSEDDNETSQYQQHFLLAANAYLDNGLSDNKEPKPSNTEYNKALAEYYGIIRYGYTDMCDACYIHANNFIRQFGNNENNSYVNDSKAIIDRLEHMYSDYITVTNISSNTIPEPGAN